MLMLPERTVEMESIEHKLNAHIQQSLTSNVSLLKEIFTNTDDIAYREFVFRDLKDDIKVVCIYTEGLVDTKEVNSVIETFNYRAKELLEATKASLLGPDFVKKIKTDILYNQTLKVITKITDGIEAILSGDTLIIIDQSDEAMIISTKGWNDRSIEEPSTEQVVRGPRDGFTENLRTNTALVRRRIRDPLLKIESIKIGTKSKTDINIAYLDRTVKEGLVKEVKARLSKIKVDSILDSGYVEEFIRDAPFSPFTMIQSTERPDKVASAIFEGRVAIFVDNSPFVLIVPTYFWQFLQASDDYYLGYIAGSFFRVIRYFAFIISLVLSSIYVMLVSFHQEMIPTPLALTIASGREVVPFPILVEALVMELSFELMREAGIRMPKPVGQAVSIVGSLVVGQAAVQAGLVSPFMVIIVAITGISSFAIPNYAASFSIRFLRFPLLLASGALGLLGFATMFFLLAIHAISLRSFGEPYLAPATPIKTSDQKDSIFRMPWWKMERQPQLAEGMESRESHDQMPKPPKK